ncbi:MAG: alpha-glucosidase [Trueperaceae bacterium]|nr:MAG: alpha-glucosidase [Trueperaceae bacterium]
MKQIAIHLTLAYLIVQLIACAPASDRLEVGGDLAPAFEMELDLFTISLEEGALRIQHDAHPGRDLWSSVPNRAFVSASTGNLEVVERAQHLYLEDRIEARCDQQSLERLETIDTALVLTGTLRCDDDTSVPYTLTLEAIDDAQIELLLELPPPYRAELIWSEEPDARIFGFGAQYTHLDLQGRRVPVIVSEQGVGRGLQPLTFAAELQSGAGGTWHNSYAPIPQFMTSDLRAMYLTNSAPSMFDLRHPHLGRATVFDSNLTARVLAGRDPTELIEIYTRYAGRMRPLPSWILSGAVVGLQGGPAKVEAVVAQLTTLDTPLAAVWLQDWVGQRTVGSGERLWWNWELDRERYLDWEGMVDRLRSSGIEVLTYVNPFLVDAAEKPGSSRNLFQEAAEQGFLVERPEGGIYLVDQIDFPAALIDLSHPEARSWLIEALEEQLLSSDIRGWMADFGEGLPTDAKLADGDAFLWHNHYPEAWAELNRELIERQEDSDQYVFFMRSGYTRSPRSATLFWLGDQLVSWDRFDGIKSAVTGLLSSGFSGFSLQHADIGGFTSIGNPLLRYRRSDELLARWAELAAFTTIFRTHEGLRPAENAQIYDSSESLEHFSAMAKLYAAWEGERSRLVTEAATLGLPVVRHLFLHYSGDPEVLDLDRQFLVGRDLLVAPVLDPGRDRIEVYLPAGSGTWIHLWSGQAFEAGQGSWIEVEAPLGRPAAFYRQNSAVGRELVDGLRRADLMD